MITTKQYNTCIENISTIDPDDLDYLLTSDPFPDEPIVTQAGMDKLKQLGTFGNERYDSDMVDIDGLMVILNNSRLMPLCEQILTDDEVITVVLLAYN